MPTIRSQQGFSTHVCCFAIGKSPELLPSAYRMWQEHELQGRYETEKPKPSIRWCRLDRLRRTKRLCVSSKILQQGAYRLWRSRWWLPARGGHKSRGKYKSCKIGKEKPAWVSHPEILWPSYNPSRLCQWASVSSVSHLIPTRGWHIDIKDMCKDQHVNRLSLVPGTWEAAALRITEACFIECARHWLYGWEPSTSIIAHHWSWLLATTVERRETYLTRRIDIEWSPRGLVSVYGSFCTIRMTWSLVAVFWLLQHYSLSFGG